MNASRHSRHLPQAERQSRWKLALSLVLLALSCLAAADVLSERRERVSNMSPEQQQILLDNQQRLARLTPQEQQRLREFAAALERDPAADRLRETMRRYAAWVERLPIERRSELLQLAGDAKLARIKQWLSGQATPTAERLSPEDSRALLTWLEHRVLDSLPDDQRKRFEQAPTQERYRMIGRMVWQRSQQAGFPQGLALRPQDFQALTDSLSPAARRQLAQAATARRGSQLVGEWIKQVLSTLVGPARGPMGFNRAGGEFRRFPSREGSDGLQPPGDQRRRGDRRPPGDVPVGQPFQAD